MVATSSSPVHKASLVDPSTHSPALLELIDIKVSRPVIEYCIEATIDTVDFAMGRPSSSKRGRGASRHAAFATFAHNVITRAELTTPVLLAALVYMDRARPHLHIALEEWACERVLLGALMVAAKYTNDSTLKNVHWALCTGVFGKRDVGRIEREFLDVLDWELAVLEHDLLAHHEGLIAVAYPHTHHGVSRKHAQHHTRHARAGSAGSVPALEPSSPHSGSSSSPSPRTPETLVSYVGVDPMDVDTSAHAYEPQRPAPVPVSRPVKKSNSHNGAFNMASVQELLRAFPVPSHSHSHRHHHERPLSVVA